MKIDKKYMTIQDKRTSIILLIWINCFLVIDMITTILLLNNGGQELNTLLIYLTTTTGLTINNIVILTHIIALLIIICIMYYILHRETIKLSNLHMIRGVFIIYLLVIINNIIGIFARFYL